MIKTKIEFGGGAAARAARSRVTAGLARVLAELPVEPMSARVAFSDENGPKGGEAIRCAFEIRLPRRPAVHVEGMASTPRLALDAGLEKLERRLRRMRQSTRESKRRPKKYYAAARALSVG
jgi:ribosome-associated translation inhibitor RaiA